MYKPYYSNMIDSYTLIGTAIIATIPIGYFYRKTIQEKCVELISLGSDAYIELKWKYGVKKSPPMMNDEQCVIAKICEDYTEYFFNESVYITFGAVPSVQSIESLTCEGEAISDIVFTVKKGCLDLDETETTKIKKLITKLAGPLCDFHGYDPSLGMVNKICNGIVDNVDNIIVNTEYFKEFILN